MPFIAAGLAFADTDVTTVDSNALRTRYNQPRIGASLGAGVDFVRRDNWLGRVEYVYDRFGSTSFGTAHPDHETEHFDLQTSMCTGPSSTSCRTSQAGGRNRWRPHRYSPITAARRAAPAGRRGASRSGDGNNCRVHA